MGKRTQMFLKADIKIHDSNICVKICKIGPEWGILYISVEIHTWHNSHGFKLYTNERD